MNNELIPVFESTIDDELVPTINARDLHKFLESKQDFSTWIKIRIEQYNFLENQDFVCSSITVTKRGGSNKIDYYVSLNMAKCLAMSEKSEKGNELKKYIAKMSIITIDDLLNSIVDIDIPEVDMYVYVVREKFSNRFKVGISSNPVRRIKELNIGNPEPLELIDYRLAPNKYKNEKQVHNMLSSSHMRSEWFSCTEDEAVNAVKSVCTKSDNI